MRAIKGIAIRPPGPELNRAIPDEPNLAYPDPGQCASASRFGAIHFRRGFAVMQPESNSEHHKALHSERGRRFVAALMVRLLAAFFISLIAIVSFVSRPRPSDRASAPLLATAHIPLRVRTTIERSCRDCHSEATRYPWYSYVAPISFLINRDVQRGREHLNLSVWSEYSIIRRERCLSEIANQVQDRGMPLSAYTLVHRNAKLSTAEIEALFEWTQEERARLITENYGREVAPSSGQPSPQSR